MMSAQSVAYAAISISLLSLIALLFSLPTISSLITAINVQLEQDVQDFKILEDDIWQIYREKLHSSQGAHSRFARDTELTKRHARPAKPKSTSVPAKSIPTSILKAKVARRQTSSKSYCDCDAKNTCPPGPPGKQGEPGQDGKPGDKGPAGAPGLEGNFPVINYDHDQKCRACPKGHPGPVGPAGPRGPPGQNGGLGRAGHDGHEGGTGEVGKPGNAGEPGKDGQPGAAGPPGENGTVGSKGETGPAGAAGPAGPKGAAGKPGGEGKKGGAGRVGVAGPGGEAGPAGNNGPAGPPGPNGPPGKDATYCPCPKRAFLHKTKKA